MKLTKDNVEKIRNNHHRLHTFKLNRKLYNLVKQSLIKNDYNEIYSYHIFEPNLNHVNEYCLNLIKSFKDRGIIIEPIYKTDRRFECYPELKFIGFRIYLEGHNENN